MGKVPQVRRERFAGKASTSFPSAATCGAGDEYCGSGTSEMSVVEPCGLTLIAAIPGGVNMMLHSGICVFIFILLVKEENEIQTAEPFSILQTITLN